jgi:hypothetical protein
MFALEHNMRFAIGSFTVELEAETVREQKELARALRVLHDRVVQVGTVIHVPSSPDEMKVSVVQLVAS